jgi:hypothetical protein
MRSIAGAIFVYAATSAYYAQSAYYARPGLYLPGLGGRQATLVDQMIPIVEALIGLALVFDDVYGWRRAWPVLQQSRRDLNNVWPAGSLAQSGRIILAYVWPARCRRWAGRSYLIIGTLLGALVGWIAGQFAFPGEPTSDLVAAPGATIGLLAGVAVDAVARRRSFAHDPPRTNTEELAAVDRDRNAAERDPTENFGR